MAICKFICLKIQIQIFISQAPCLQYAGKYYHCLRQIFTCFESYIVSFFCYMPCIPTYCILNHFFVVNVQEIHGVRPQHKNSHIHNSKHDNIST